MTSNHPRYGVLLSNLGTPDAPTTEALRRYLAEFLWDRRVVDLPRPLWWLILHGLILRTRPARSAAKYRTIWTDAGSPLLVISQRQRALLESALGQMGHEVPVVLGMRYGNPSIAGALNELMAAGVEHIIILPLYPQYSCSTSASTFDAVANALSRRRHVPALSFIADYHLHPGYLDALAQSIADIWQRDGQGERLLISFHGTPRRYHDEGDPYYDQCLATAEKLALRLGLAPQQWQVVFQSRFGREEWLQPYADEVIEQLARDGVRRLDVVCPGFAADCLETLEEMAEENRRLFLDAGGESYRYLPALNDREDHVRALARIAAARMK